MAIEERRLDRRQALMGAGLLGAGAVAALLPAGAAAADEEGEHPAGLEGAWLEQVIFDDGSSPHQVLSLYTRGGGVVGDSNFPPNSGSTGIGAWKQVAARQYEITFQSFAFAPSGQHVGMLRIRALATYNRTTDEISGPARVEFQPAGSPVFLPPQHTHFTGKRIVALPL